MDKNFHLPSYDELPLNNKINMRYSWGVFGKEDELGTINLLTSKVIKRAAKEIQKGDIFNLSLPLNWPNPPLFSSRGSYQHHIISSNRNTQDDYIDNFYLQASSQWDALRHVRAREFGFYNGITGEEAGPQGNKLGIEKYAEHGIVGRGLLVDVAAHMEKRGDEFNPLQDFPITVELLEEVIKTQGCQPEVGDILLLRTGFMKAYLNATPEDRITFEKNKECIGLTGKEETAKYLWDLNVSAVCADNMAVERIPGSPEDGSLHRRLIPMLGFALGELFNFETLSDDCAEDGRYTCYFTAVPLNLPNGVGSPANAIAVK